MKKFDAFNKSLEILLHAEKEKAASDEIYRMGVVGKFNLTFELAWEALKEILEIHGVSNFKTGSPREIFKTAYQFNFLNDEKIWLEMLARRNTIAHIYDETAAIELANLIFDKYLAALANLRERIADAEI